MTSPLPQITPLPGRDLAIEMALDVPAGAPLANRPVNLLVTVVSRVDGPVETVWIYGPDGALAPRATITQTVGPLVAGQPVQFAVPVHFDVPREYSIGAAIWDPWGGPKATDSLAPTCYRRGVRG